MYRLTKKIDYPEYANDYEITCNYNYEIINKLGKLEDLEEELGCPLDVVFKAMKNGIYVGNCSKKTKYLTLVVLGGDFVFDNDLTDFIYLEQYKTFWWLKEDKSE